MPGVPKLDRCLISSVVLNTLQTKKPRKGHDCQICNAKHQAHSGWIYTSVYKDMIEMKM